MTMPRRPEGGYTFVELLVVVTILLILASAVMPLAQVVSHGSVKRRPSRFARCAPPSTSSRTPSTRREFQPPSWRLAAKGIHRISKRSSKGFRLPTTRRDAS